MIRHFILILSAFIILGCALGGGGGIATSDDEGRIDFKRVTKFDGRVLDVEVTTKDGSTINLNTARDSAYSIPSLPLMPNHSGRSWTLLNTAGDSATLAYALVAWDNEDPSDYLLAGWWLHFPGLHPPDLPLSQAENGLFIGGPEFGASDTFQMPIKGEATYSGGAGGLYIYEYGGNWGDLAGTEATEEYGATLTLTADFANRTVDGAGLPRLRGRHQRRTHPSAQYFRTPAE